MDACPVSIPLQDLLLSLRRRKAAAAGGPSEAGWKAWAAAWSRPLTYRASLKAAAARPAADALRRHGARAAGLGPGPHPAPAGGPVVPRAMEGGRGVTRRPRPATAPPSRPASAAGSPPACPPTPPIRCHRRSTPCRWCTPTASTRPMSAGSFMRNAIATRARRCTTSTAPTSPTTSSPTLVERHHAGRAVVSRRRPVGAGRRRGCAASASPSVPSPWTASAAADLGVTSATAAIATTGTLVQDSHELGGRTASLLPPAHLCLVPASRIVATSAEVLRRGSATAGRCRRTSCSSPGRRARATSSRSWRSASMARWPSRSCCCAGPGRGRLAHPPIGGARGVSRCRHPPSIGSAVTDLLSPSSVDRGEGGGPPASRVRVVLDTSVLVADPSCIASFIGADVVIPLTVIEELDGLKSRVDDVGRAARTALRTTGGAAGQRRRLAGRRHCRWATAPRRAP